MKLGQCMLQYIQLSNASLEARQEIFRDVLCRELSVLVMAWSRRAGAEYSSDNFLFTGHLVHMLFIAQRH